jgi:hypothetical protein
MPLDSAPRRSKFVAWAPEFSAGTASLILTIAGGIFYFGGELKTQRTEIDQVKRDALADASRSKEAIANVAADVKGIQATVNSMNETLAGMKVMQQITQQQATQRAPK